MEKNHKAKIEDEIKNTVKDEEIKILSEELEKESKKVSDYYEQIITLKAEFENYRKRSEKETANTILREKKNTLCSFLPVMDSLLRTKESMSRGNDNINKSVEIVIKELEKIFSNFKIKRMNCAGKKFCPHVHNAVMAEKTKELKPGEIIKVIDNGYYCEEEVLKPANVVVAENDDENDDENSEVDRSPLRRPADEAGGK